VIDEGAVPRGSRQFVRKIAGTSVAFLWRITGLNTASTPFFCWGSQTGETKERRNNAGLLFFCTPDRLLLP
jgi:hypothetical protein